MKLKTLKEIALLFLKLGAISFGGPAAHNSMIEQEVVVKKGWISREKFLDFFGIANLIPGPISTQMAIFIGYSRGGLPGLIVAGTCFILPAALITLLFAYIYSIYGSAPQLGPIMSGIRAAVISIIISSIYRLSKSAIKKWYFVLLLIAVAVLNYFGVNGIIILLCSGLLGLFWSNRIRIKKFLFSVLKYQNNLLGFSLLGIQTSSVNMISQPGIFNIFLYFFKVGLVLFGGGYVLFSFIHGDLVDNYHWLTNNQLLDAIAVGQFTPGPILSTATFIGYQISGISGALVATIGIFLPSFILVLLVYPFILKLRDSKIFNGFLDGVNAAALGLMVSVCILLAQSSLVNLQYWIIFIFSIILVISKKANPVLIITASGALGYIFSIL